MHYFKIRFHFGIAACLLLVLSRPAVFAQNGKIHESGKGCWRLFTDPHSRGTTVKFYDTQGLLVYEEIIPGKYIKLTKRNVRLLNQALDRLVGNQLIASSVKSSELTVYNQPSILNIPSERLRDELKEAKASISKADLHVNSHVNLSKLRVIFENPGEELVTVRILDPNNFTIYEERSFLSRYLRDFDLIGLKAAQYILEVKGQNSQFSRQITLSYATNAPLLRIISPDAIEATDRSLPYPAAGMLENQEQAN